MIELPEVIVCESCDAVCRRRVLRRREVARCARCGAELGRHDAGQRSRLLPLTLASIVMFSIANLFPIVEMELRGITSETTLMGAVQALAHDGRLAVSVLVFATTVLFPLCQMLILVWLLVPLGKGRTPVGFAFMVRLMQSLRPWGMIEVFLLGVLVAIVKLSSLAQVIPGPALWAFGLLTVLLTTVLSFDPQGFWEMARMADTARAAPGDAVEARPR